MGTIYVGDDARGVTVYHAPDADLVPELVDALSADLGRGPDVQSIVRAAMAHLNPA
jgi:hypothetical protein